MGTFVSDHSQNNWKEDKKKKERDLILHIFIRLRVTEILLDYLRINK